MPKPRAKHEELPAHSRIHKSKEVTTLVADALDFTDRVILITGGATGSGGQLHWRSLNMAEQ
jgi:hypothetical protein